MKKLRITIGNTSYDVTVEDLTDDHSFTSAPRPTPSAAQPQSPPPVHAATAAGGAAKPQLPIAAGAVASPMAGVIKSVLVKEGQQVKQGEPLVILEAMKMENQITAPVAGSVKSIGVKEGDSVPESHVLVVLE